jgi:hypothetical protein
MASERQARPFLQSKFSEQWRAVSRNGQWVAYPRYDRNNMTTIWRKASSDIVAWWGGQRPRDSMPIDPEQLALDRTCNPSNVGQRTITRNTELRCSRCYVGRDILKDSHRLLSCLLTFQAVTRSRPYVQPFHLDLPLTRAHSPKSPWLMRLRASSVL